METFSVNKSIANKLNPLCGGRYIYNKRIVRWDKSDFFGVGFCFFLIREEARKAKKVWMEEIKETKESNESSIIVKIIYKKGLGKHIEDNFINSYSPRIALCQEFELDPEYTGFYHF